MPTQPPPRDGLAKRTQMMTDQTASVLAQAVRREGGVAVMASSSYLDAEAVIDEAVRSRSS